MEYCLKLSIKKLSLFHTLFTPKLSRQMIQMMQFFPKKIYFGLLLGKITKQSGHCGKIGNTGSFTRSYDLSLLSISMLEEKHC